MRAILFWVCAPFIALVCFPVIITGWFVEKFSQLLLLVGTFCEEYAYYYSRKWADFWIYKVIRPFRKWANAKKGLFSDNPNFDGVYYTIKIAEWLGYIFIFGLLYVSLVYAMYFAGKAGYL